MQFTLPEQSDWCDNMTLRSYNYAPVLPVNVSRPYFRQGRRAHVKNLVSEEETMAHQKLVYSLVTQLPPISLHLTHTIVLHCSSTRILECLGVWLDKGRLYEDNGTKKVTVTFKWRQCRNKLLKWGGGRGCERFKCPALWQLMPSPNQHLRGFLVLLFSLYTVLNLKFWLFIWTMTVLPYNKQTNKQTNKQIDKQTNKNTTAFSFRNWKMRQ